MKIKVKKKTFFLILAIILLAVFLSRFMLPASYDPYPEQSGTVVGTGEFDYSTVPEYSGDAYIAINGNVPYFSQSEITTDSFEEFSELDALNRCGVVWSCIGQDLMPTEERGSISGVKPSGWQTARYDGLVDGNYLYNRCHLIGFQLTGENANERNLITGTRYLNIEGMLPFEDMVADYVKETGNHVMYRVTPVFLEEDLVARGVLMEGWSVEDNGEGICFCVFAYNAQPGIEIDYATGDSWESDTVFEEDTENASYIGNKNSQVFHKDGCSGLPKEENRVYFDSREQALKEGYEACSRCNP